MKTFFFGYGSLMYPGGINGRGMKYIYDWSDLFWSELLGYKRGMFAHLINNYYGIMKSNGSVINGIVFEIHSDHDLERLLINEGAHKSSPYVRKEFVYEVKEVSNLIVPNFDGKVLTLVNTTDKSYAGRATKSYVKHVYDGIQPWGQGFMDKFLETGGLKPEKESGFVPVIKYLKSKMP